MTDLFEIKTDGFISSNSLLAPASKVGVALSGGADSVAAIAVLTALGHRVTALHCNFHLRGAESDRDERHARSIAETLGASWRKIDFNVGEFQRSEQGRGMSVEMACRHLRYNWFGQMATELGLDAIAIAHNQSDRVETFFINALRSTGLKGLTSMEVRRGIYIRPLLGMSRREIEEYLNRRGLNFVTDHTNLTEDYSRNKLRLGVIPPMVERFPDAIGGISRTMSHLDGVKRLYERLVAERAARYTDSADGSIDIATLAANEPEAAQLLFEMVSPSGLNFSQVTDILSAAPGASGLQFGEWLLSRGRLHRRTSVDPVSPPAFNDCCRMSIIDRCEFRPSPGCRKAWFDSSILDGEPVFSVRKWQTGDRMQPFGMKGTRLLSDIFSDARLNVDQKKNVPVVCRNDSVIWLPGLKNSALFPVTPATTKVVEMTWTQSPF